MMLDLTEGRMCEEAREVDDNLRVQDLEAERTAADAGPDMMGEIVQILNQEV